MNAYLNYLLEASIGLCLFLLIYQLLLRKETNFRLNRIFLLVAIIASITFPLFKLNVLASPVPSLNFSVPEMEQLTAIPTEAIPEETQPIINPWKIAAYLYVGSLMICLILFVIRLTKIIKTLRQAPKYKFSNHNIIELKGDQSPFSFFNYIFIGSSPITDDEKKQILEHEAIHAKLYHSIDILLLNALGIVFWFNPIVRFYKKIFVQLHEFEADARAVEKHDVNEYCTLVAKVALQSANFKLANHFSNSLTIKRIEMMRTLKQKIKMWKIIAVSAIVPVFFFVVACQDQAEELYTEVEVIEDKIEYPANVQRALAKLKAENPYDKFVILPSQSGKLPGFGLAGYKTMTDSAISYTADVVTKITSSDLKDGNGKPIPYFILQYKAKTIVEEVEEEAIEIPNSEKVFLVVEQPPTYRGGTDKMWGVISQNVQYPVKARNEGIEGTVFVSFIVEKDGTISESTLIKGISKECDEEALRVVKKLDSWNPGMQSGNPVRVKFVMPVKFKL